MSRVHFAEDYEHKNEVKELAREVKRKRKQRKNLGSGMAGQAASAEQSYVQKRRKSLSY